MAMFTAMPTYSAMTPRAKRIAPVVIMSRIIVEVHPGATHRPVARPTARATARTGARSRAAAPVRLTSRSGVVPLDRTSRQKCESRRRRSYPEGRSASVRIGTDTVATRRATHEIATSR